MSARTLAIGDIHGCDTALETMLARLQPTADDTVVVLGDVVDRGPDTKRCVDLLLELREQCKLVFIMGNHEEMMLDALNMGGWGGSWGSFGGQETIESYGGISQIPESHIEFMKSAVGYHESHNAIFVHANLQPGVPLADQTVSWLRWNHLSGHEQPHPSGKWVVCGHTRLPDGVPAILNGWVCIDTYACGMQWLTCLDTNGFIVHQTNEAGDYQGGMELGEIAVYFRPRN